MREVASVRAGIAAAQIKGKRAAVGAQTGIAQGLRKAARITVQEVERVGADVGEDRTAAQVQHDVAAGREGQRGHDHLVAGADARREGGDVQGGRPRVHGHRVTGAGAGGHRALELGHARAGGEPVVLQRVGHGLDVVVVDELAAVGQEARPHRRARRSRFALSLIRRRPATTSSKCPLRTRMANQSTMPR